ncbi:M50 family metallopeptidase [Lysobacter sp. ESA13C]|uniref:M50 family metallopeptidase n=1 Tax=unclassified Lysobacter TaxID=2635362 RepID=UPI001CBFF70B|nr:M50 family metallopeptidase [Lysobacter sp. ESA13C]
MDAPADDELAPTRAAPVAWDLSPRWQRFFGKLNTLLTVLTWCGFVVLLVNTDAQYNRYGPLLLIATVVPVLWLTLAIHEGGHWLSAHLFGMTTVRVIVGSLEIQPRRRGLRLRRRPCTGNSSIRGLVEAYAQPGCDPRRALLVQALGGPLANLLMAGAGLAIAFGSESPTSQKLWELFAFLNLSTGLSNLLPRATDGSANDGLLFLQAWRNRHEQLAGAASYEIHRWLLHSEPHEQLPEELLGRLIAEPEPVPLVHDWFCFQHALQRGGAETARRLLAQMQARFDTYDETLQAQNFAAMELCKIEGRYLQAWTERDAAIIDLVDPRTPVLWYVPHVLPRLRALAAALRGDRETARKQLVVSRRYAEGAIEPRLRAHEARLRREIEALIDAGPGSLHKDRETVASA